MNQHNNPPFAIGQRVVCLKTSQIIYGLQAIKGETYTVVNCVYCCKRWHVQLRELAYVGYGSPVFCHIENVPKFCGGMAKYFAPIITKRDHSNVEIAEEIKRLPVVEERSDVKKKEVVV